MSDDPNYSRECVPKSDPFIQVCMHPNVHLPNGNGIILCWLKYDITGTTRSGIFYYVVDAGHQVDRRLIDFLNRVSNTSKSSETHPHFHIHSRRSYCYPPFRIYLICKEVSPDTSVILIIVTPMTSTPAE